MKKKFIGHRPTWSRERKRERERKERNICLHSVMSDVETRKRKIIFISYH